MKKNITKLFILVCGISLLVLTIVNADKNKNSKEFEEYVLVKNGDLGRIDSVSRNFSELLDFFVLDQSHSLLNIDESLWSEELSAYTPERINEIYKNCNLPTRKFLYVVDNFVGYPFETVENHSITLIPTEYRDYIWRLVLYSFHKYGDVYTEYSYDEYDNVHMSYSPLSEEEIYDRWVETVEKTATEYLQDWFDAGYGYMTRDELNNWNIKNPLPTRADLEGNHSLPWGTYQYNAFLYEPLKRIDMELYDDYRIVQELLLLHPYLDPSVKALPLTKEEECTVLYYYDTSGGKISSSIQRKTGSYIYYFSISENKYINSGILSGHIGNTLIENEEFFNIVKNLQSEGYHAVTYDDTRYDFAYDSIAWSDPQLFIERLYIIFGVNNGSVKAMEEEPFFYLLNWKGTQFEDAIRSFAEERGYKENEEGKLVPISTVSTTNTPTPSPSIQATPSPDVKAEDVAPLVQNENEQPVISLEDVSVVPNQEELTTDSDNQIEISNEKEELVIDSKDNESDNTPISSETEPEPIIFPTATEENTESVLEPKTIDEENISEMDLSMVEAPERQINPLPFIAIGCIVILLVVIGLKHKKH